MSRAMKDSGIPWIGEIPKGWDTLKIKQVMRNKSIKGFPNETVLSLYRDYGVVPKDSRDDNHNVTSEDTSSYKLVEIGDFVINKMKAWQGSMAVSQYRGIISPAYYICHFKNDGVDRRYIHYLLRNDSYKAEYMRLSSGLRVGQWDLNIDDFLSIPMVLPPVPEQQQIAEFLDRKCAEIDEAVALQEEFIEELKAYKQSVITEAVTRGLDPNAKFKPSGIDWIGDIPENWVVAKMNRICSVITDFVASGSFESLRKNVPYLDTPDFAMLVRTADLSGSAKSSGRVYISEHSYNFLRNSNLYGGEIVLPNIGASVGDVYMVPILYERMSLAPNAIMFKTTLCDKYYFYYYSSKVGREAIINISQSTAQAKFNKTELREIRVLVPPLSEQQQITDYLDKKCAEIDNLIAIKQQKIEELKEYKKSIIYEYVTGKKEVDG